MSKISKTQRQRNYFNSIDKIKKELNSKTRKENSKPYSRRSQEERDALAVAQKAYEERQKGLIELSHRLEIARLRKELDKLFESD